jgi:hypothetical protein
LSISPSQIRVVSVHAGSTVLALQVFDHANVSSDPNVNNQQRERLVTLATDLQQKVVDGEFQLDGYPLQTMIITPPEMEGYDPQDIFIDNTRKSNNDSLSSGAIGAIVGCSIGAALLLALVTFIWYKRREKASLWDAHKLPSSPVTSKGASVELVMSPSTRDHTPTISASSSYNHKPLPPIPNEAPSIPLSTPTLPPLPKCAPTLPSHRPVLSDLPSIPSQAPQLPSKVPIFPPLPALPTVAPTLPKSLVPLTKAEINLLHRPIPPALPISRPTLHYRTVSEPGHPMTYSDLLIKLAREAAIRARVRRLGGGEYDALKSEAEMQRIRERPRPASISSSDGSAPGTPRNVSENDDAYCAVSPAIGPNAFQLASTAVHTKNNSPRNSSRMSLPPALPSHNPPSLPNRRPVPRT